MRAVMGDGGEAGDAGGGAGLWRGLRAFLVDGSSTITPDTPELRKAFGQPAGQKKGCGFPVPKTHFAQLKTTLRVRKVKSRTGAGVLKELAVYCLMYNLVRAVMVKAAA